MAENKLPEFEATLRNLFPQEDCHYYRLRHKRVWDAAQAPLIERIKELEAALKHAQEMTAVEALVAVKWQRKADELERQNAELRSALEGITEVAERVDSWESFPSGPIEKAWAALASSQGQQKGGV